MRLVVLRMRLLYLSENQRSMLRKWKDNAQKGRDWSSSRNRCLQGHRCIHRLIEDSNFLEGKDLKEREISTLFSCAKRGMGGRALNSNLYVRNGLQKFNAQLRLLFGDPDRVPESFEEFVGLEGVGIWSASQLLCKWAPEDYPFVATIDNPHIL